MCVAQCGVAGLRSESSWSVSSLGTFRDESSLQGPLLREKEGGGEGKGGREKRREGGGGGREEGENRGQYNAEENP